MSKLGEKLIASAKEGVAIARGELDERYMQIVAWRVKDYADGWILFHDEGAARQQAQESGAKIEALYRLMSSSKIA